MDKSSTARQFPAVDLTSGPSGDTGVHDLYIYTGVPCTVCVHMHAQ